MNTVRLARHAMATRFEIVLYGEDTTALRAAGEEALDQVERLESQLSLYRETSEVAYLNARAATKPVRVTPTLFALLQHAQALSAETDGAFDITIAPLVRCWGFMHGPGSLPSSEALAEARAGVGMHHLLLDPENLTAQFTHPGTMVDLGGIGKGYAVEFAAQILRECGVESALLHGGTSSIYALGHPPDQPFWKVAIDGPPQTDPGAPPSGVFATVPLVDQSMSVSAVWGKSFEAGGRTYGHLLDPRTGEPASSAVLAAVLLPSATETEVFSTALIILGAEGQDKFTKLRPAMASVLVTRTDGGYQVTSRNLQIEGAR